MTRRFFSSTPAATTAAVAGVLLAIAVAATGCGRNAAPPPTPDEKFLTLIDEVIEDHYQRNPTQATYLGIHKYDDRLEDLSLPALEAASERMKQFRARVRAVEPSTLSIANQLDREQVLAALDSQLLTQDVIRPWVTNPDTYSSGITQTAFVMIKRSYAPPEVRLKSLIAREKLMVKSLDNAKRNLNNPPEILTKIAIEQLDGNREFFASAVPAAFTSVKDKALLDEFAQSNKAVLDALSEYKTFLVKNLLPRSKGGFPIGRDALVKKLEADEMVTLPLEQLLAIAHADMLRNQDALKDLAAQIAPGKPVTEVMASITSDHPAPDQLLTTTQQMLDSLRQFIVDKKILTVPQHQPAHVEETPPFLRATTSASMDIPGPFEKVATEAYYNMTLPDPAWPKAQTESFMRQWYYAMISNVSVHEAYPGHYVQFLYASQFPSKVRKVYGAASNAEGWAHYCEQMMLDEGLKADDPKYRLAQLQDALLRDVRFIAGIKMHSEGLSIEDAQKMFEEEAYQPGPVALSEAKRGTTDPTYGYYTMGKLMILKLRDDYRAKKGSAYSLQEFHDTFLKLGPLPLPLMRRAMLGEKGEPFPEALTRGLTSR